MVIPQYQFLVLKLCPLYTVSLNTILSIPQNQCYPGTPLYLNLAAIVTYHFLSKLFIGWFGYWFWIRNNWRNRNATTRCNSKIHSTRLHQGGDLFSNTQCEINSSECFVPSKWFSKKKTLKSIQGPHYLQSELFMVLNWF